MKIAILVPNFSKYSGDAVVARQQAEELAGRGNRVAVFAFNADMDVSGADLYLLGWPRSLLMQRIYRLFFFLDVFKIYKWLQVLKCYHQIICHLYPMTWLAFLARLIYRVNYTFWYHGIPGHEHFSRPAEKIYISLDMFLTALTVRNADRAVSVSRSGQKELKGFSGLESEVVYNTADKQRFYPGLDGRPVREKLGLGDAPVILYVGQVAPQKGVHLLVRAFQMVRSALPEARLVIVGRETFSYYSAELKKLCDESVIFAGYVTDELPLYYAACDVYATCSPWECHNLPVLEAQACGREVVAFDIGPFREGVSRGVLVRNGDIEEFARACISVIKRVRRIRENAYC